MEQKERDQLVEQNMGFVVSTARQYVGRGLSLDDLISEGSIEVRPHTWPSFRIVCRDLHPSPD